MRRRRVKITGVGPVTPVGVGRAEFLHGIQQNVSHVHPLPALDKYENGGFVGAEVTSELFTSLSRDLALAKLPRHTQFAVVAGKLALQDAGLDFKNLTERHPLVLAGASLMDFGVMNKIMDRIVRKGPGFGLPSAVFNSSTSAIAGAIAERIGGPTQTMALQSACCSGLDAIGHAALKIASGEAEIALCGGTEAPLYFHPMLELRLAGLAPDTVEMPDRLCRPFDLWRTTGVISEGACFFVLEPEESPREAIATLDGYAYATDPVEQPVEGLRMAIKLALANAGKRKDEVECINAWGPGHKLIDRAEALVLKGVFGESLPHIPAVSIKGALGNPLGASGAIQTGVAALGLRESFIPPTVNWQHPDPECSLNLSAECRAIDHETTLVNSHGLSGTNACLVLSK